MAYNEKEKAFWYQRFTLEGRVFYPNLIEPKANDAGVLKFGCLFAWKQGSNQNETQRIGQFLAQAKAENFATIPDAYFVNPCKKWETHQRMDGKPNAEFLRGHYWLNLSSGLQYPPPIINKQMQKVIDKAEVYSGRNCVVNISFYKIDNNKKGVGTNILGIMLTEGGEKEGGSAELNIQEVFGSFAQDMNRAQPPQGQQWQGQQPAAAPQGHQPWVGQQQPVAAPNQPWQPNGNPYNPNGNGNGLI